MRLIPNFISEQYNKCIFYKETKKFKKDLTVIDLASKVEESERKRIRMMGKVKPEDTFGEASEKVTIEDDSVLYTKVVAGGKRLKIGDQFLVEEGKIIPKFRVGEDMQGGAHSRVSRSKSPETRKPKSLTCTNNVRNCQCDVTDPASCIGILKMK